MTALPDLNVSGATVGQIFKVDFRNNIVNATLNQQYQSESDVILIYNLSPCNFQVTLMTTSRTFNLPSGVTSNPIPLSYRGSSDTGLNFLVKSIITAGTPNTVSFDWFRPGEPILAAPASSNPGVGSVSLTTLTTTNITFPAPVDNWSIGEDGSGNLNFADTTTGNTLQMERTGVMAALSYTTTGIAGSTFYQVEIPSTVNDQNQIIDIVDNTASSVHWGLGKQSHANGDFFRIVDVTHGVASFVVAPSTNGIITAGGIASMSGQVTAGTLGVPLTVAQTSAPVVISGTGTTNIITFTPPADGLYMALGTFTYINTGAGTVTFWTKYTDPVTGGGPAAVFGSQSGFLAGLGFGASTGTSVPCEPEIFWAKGGAAITVQFADTTNVPSSHVSATLLRLS